MTYTTYAVTFDLNGNRTIERAIEDHPYAFPHDVSYAELSVAKRKRKRLHEQFNAAGGKLHKFGIEKTFVYPVWDQGSGEENELLVDNLTYSVSSEIEDTLPVPVYSCGTDPGCVEIASLPMTSIEQAKLFFDGVSKPVLKRGFVHKHEAVVGTGGHIHVDSEAGKLYGGPPLSKLLFNFAFMNPWLNLLADPQDDMNAPSLGVRFVSKLIEYKRDTSTIYRCYYKDAAEAVTAGDLAGNVQVLAEMFDQKWSTTTDPGYYLDEAMAMIRRDAYRKHHGHLTIKYREDTCEFRCFDVVSDWAEQLLHINLVQAILAHVKAKHELYSMPNIDAIDLVRQALMKPEDLRAGFTGMIEMLGLSIDEKEYGRYLSRAKLRCKTDADYLRKNNRKVSLGERTSGWHLALVL